MMTTEMTAAMTAGSDVVLVEEAAVVVAATEAALVAEDEQPRRSGRKLEPATTTTTMARTTARTTARRTVSEETAVIALPAPARPQSSQGNPFMIFFISKRDETKAGNPNASFNEIKSIIQKEWCKLPKEERAKYKYGFESVQAEGELDWQSALSLALTTFTHSFLHCCHSLSDASIITDGDSESESGAESTVDDIGNPFTLIEVVRKVTTCLMKRRMRVLLLLTITFVLLSLMVSRFQTNRLSRCARTMLLNSDISLGMTVQPCSIRVLLALSTKLKTIPTQVTK